jgi:acyl-CoA reductase-like NAD-dependent aldehyde dehydrogenase
MAGAAPVATRKDRSMTYVTTNPYSGEVTATFAAATDSEILQPTIVTDIGEDNPARYWEFFGSVSMLFRAKDEDDAVDIANDSPVGLWARVARARHQGIRQPQADRRRRHRRTLLTSRRPISFFPSYEA